MSVVVIGAGKSGQAATFLLKQLGFEVVLYDDKFPVELPEKPELVVKSPGVPGNHPVVRRYKQRGVEVIGEIELAYRYYRGKIVAITGTNGKSTTTALVYKVLKSIGYPCWIGGNYGIPFSSFVLKAKKEDVAVLELSSFQIEDLNSFRANVSVILNVTPDHMNRYSSFEEYLDTKLKLLKLSRLAVLNMDDPNLSDVDGNVLFFSRRGKANAWFDGEFIHVEDFALNVSELPLKGVHNVENYMAALLVLRSLGVSFEEIVNGFKQFKGLPHRMEFAGKVGEVYFINDSKSTNVDSLRKALESLRSIVLIAGGSDKGLDFEELTPLIRKNVKCIVAIGETASLFKRLFSNYVPVYIESDMDSAVRKAYTQSEPGDTVLLSPGCASFDMFSNFEERGEAFKSAVKKLEELVGSKQ